ncbi:trypsin-like peptidase domain-containing protein [Gordonia sp. ABSL1-1]|uniref:S1C family serine protease n=1 Tax=Gordonia sp. ABSL1-1 TaxID=3053923 RepID=UPI002573F6AD|nr:trypsin-like peptidase domain-containing protein [Gordonia sp. ABSL1-1]MDL9937075.1 trypsin-like peptidase domain-containing protein [Gordonia sp. ABSL1-1]
MPAREPLPAPRHAPVSRETAQVFGRPDGVQGSFADGAVPTGRTQPTVAAPDPVLAEAFGRPADSDESLQRDPLATYGQPDEPDEPADPWRDPESPAQLTRPAVGTPTAAAPTVAGAKLGVRDVLFGKRITWVALVTLTVIALLIGMIGALIGRLTVGPSESALHSDTVSLSTGDAQGGEPRSSVARVAQAVERSVVVIDVRTASSGGTGSGFVIDPQGYILTNNHVISMAANDKQAKLEVVFSDRTRVPARIVGRDIKTDLAVVKVDDVENLVVAKLGNSDDLQIGEEVVAFGAPLGLNRTVTSGIVSALNRAIALPPDADTDTDAVIDAIQTDAAINPGNSGGPLVNDRAEVVGINTAIRSGGGGSIGLGFAIPINQAKSIAESLIKSGTVKHPAIGVNASSVRNERVLGALIRNVVAGGSAARAGIRENDVIVSFNGRPVESADELNVAVRTATIGKETPFKYWRDGRTFDGTITPVSD